MGGPRRMGLLQLDIFCNMSVVCVPLCRLTFDLKEEREKMLSALPVSFTVRGSQRDCTCVGIEDTNTH